MKQNATWIAFLILELIWIIVVGLGILNYRGLPAGHLPLAGFDRLLRRWGPGIPFLPFVCRVLYQQFFHSEDRKSAKTKKQIDHGAPFEGFKIYATITVARWIIYASHLALIYLMREAKLSKADWLSDHIVLGASMVCISELEITILLSYPQYRRDLIMRLLIVANLVSYAMTCGDMYYTALYFHSRIQSIGGLVIGGLLQCIGLYWLIQ